MFNAFVGNLTKVSLTERLLFPLATPRIILRPEDHRKQDSSIKHPLLSNQQINNCEGDGE